MCYNQEQYCQVTSTYTKAWEDPAFPENSIRLPDGNMIVMGKESFVGPEIMFQVCLVKLELSRSEE